MTTTKTFVEIRRPDGATETLDVTERFPFGINPVRFAEMVRDNRATGRGELLRTWQVEPELTAAEIARRAVYTLEAAKEAVEDYPDRFIPARMAWEAALEEWRRNFPAEAAREDAAALKRREERMTLTADLGARIRRLAD